MLEAYPSRCELRSLAPRVRRLVERNFKIRHFEPPAGKAFCVDFEINEHMTKQIYCAKFGEESAGDDAPGSIAGAVSFMTWVPAYYRGVQASRGIRHLLPEPDACRLWRLLSKLRLSRTADSSSSRSADGGEVQVGKEGHLTITEGRLENNSSSEASVPTPRCKKEVIGLLSVAETDLVLSVLDHRRNALAQRAPLRTEVFTV